MHDGAAAGRNVIANKDATDMSIGLTVKDYIIRSNNPQTKLATEDYVVAVGQGFYWYSTALVARGAKEKNIFCLPENTLLTSGTILYAANQATKKCAGGDTFELSLLNELIEMFPCKLLLIP